MPILVCPSLKIPNMQKNPVIQNGHIEVTAIDTVKTLVPSHT